MSDPTLRRYAVFPVGDLAEAVGFYQGLGFDVEAFDGTYAWVRHEGIELIHLSLIDDLEVEANRASAYLHVKDADSWAQRWSTSDAQLDGPEMNPGACVRRVLPTRVATGFASGTICEEGKSALSGRWPTALGV